MLWKPLRSGGGCLEIPRQAPFALSSQIIVEWAELSRLRITTLDTHFASAFLSTATMTLSVLFLIVRLIWSHFTGETNQGPR